MVLKADEIAELQANATVQKWLKELATASMLGGAEAETAGNRLQIYKDMGLTVPIPHKVSGVIYGVASGALGPPGNA